MSDWVLSSSSDVRALAVVDGLGDWHGCGPHYSRRTPGSRTFTGVGREIVLVSSDGAAVFATVLQKTPARRGSGSSRGRSNRSDEAVRMVWRNVLFRNLGPVRSSDLIRSATDETFRLWEYRYGEIPTAPLRTEIKPKAIRSTNPGYCYACAGWTKGELRRGIQFYYAPGELDRVRNK